VQAAVALAAVALVLMGVVQLVQMEMQILAEALAAAEEAAVTAVLAVQV
jgi:hypothetical protein